MIRIVAETEEGSFGILPHRLDCVAVLVPGILTYQIVDKKMVYLAIDGGLLIKKGKELTVYAHNAIEGKELGKLKDLVEKEFKTVNEKEREIHSVLTKLETGFFRTLEKLGKE